MQRRFGGVWQIYECASLLCRARTHARSDRKRSGEDDSGGRSAAQYLSCLAASLPGLSPAARLLTRKIHVFYWRLVNSLQRFSTSTAPRPSPLHRFVCAPLCFLLHPKTPQLSARRKASQSIAGQAALPSILLLGNPLLP